jgi:heme/copper-type cytochrome/quinol oxidase subunit 2
LKIIIIAVIIISNIQLLLSVNAAGLDEAFGSKLDEVAGGAGYNPDVSSPESVISTIIDTVLSFLGVIFLFLIMYAGYLWMTARGNEQRLEKAKDTLTAAIIGLIIIAAAYAISYFVMSKISTQTLKPSASRINTEQINKKEFLKKEFNISIVS